METQFYATNFAENMNQNKLANSPTNCSYKTKHNFVSKTVLKNNKHNHKASHNIIAQTKLKQLLFNLNWD